MANKMPMPSLFDIRQNMALYGVLRLGENSRGVRKARAGWDYRSMAEESVQG